jgi:hypothetical protein
MFSDLWDTAPRPRAMGQLLASNRRSLSSPDTIPPLGKIFQIIKETHRSEREPRLPVKQLVRDVCVSLVRTCTDDIARLRLP